MDDYYYKQMIINRLPLPIDIIDNEIKSYVFHDKILSDTKKKKQTLIHIFKMNILSTRANFFGGTMNDAEPHWIIAFGNNVEKVKLNGHNCERCGNYLHFPSISSYDKQKLDKMICHCIPVHRIIAPRYRVE
jgi:hypothetical protein